MEVLEAFLFLSYKVERSPVSQKRSGKTSLEKFKSLFQCKECDFTTPRGSEGHSWISGENSPSPSRWLHSALNALAHARTHTHKNTLRHYPQNSHQPAVSHQNSVQRPIISLFHKLTYLCCSKEQGYIFATVCIQAVIPFLSFPNLLTLPFLCFFQSLNIWFILFSIAFLVKCFFLFRKKY